MSALGSTMQGMPSDPPRPKWSPWQTLKQNWKPWHTLAIGFFLCNVVLLIGRFWGAHDATKVEWFSQQILRNEGTINYPVDLDLVCDSGFGKIQMDYNVSDSWWSHGGRWRTIRNDGFADKSCKILTPQRLQEIQQRMQQQLMQQRPPAPQPSAPTPAPAPPAK